MEVVRKLGGRWEEDDAAGRRPSGCRTAECRCGGTGIRATGGPPEPTGGREEVFLGLQPAGDGGHAASEGERLRLPDNRGASGRFSAEAAKRKMAKKPTNELFLW